MWDIESLRLYPVRCPLQSGRKSRLHETGFALVIMMILMALLALLALGLLSLSSASIRIESSDGSVRVARANARLAMLIALGQLQQHAGPDRRITATSEVLGRGDYVTGVWDSRELDPQDPQALSEDKERNFRKWLVSNANEAATSDIGFEGAAISDPVLLVTEAVAGQGGGVRAGRVGIRASERLAGHYAFSVLDEGVKARIDLGEAPSPDGDLASGTQALGSGQNPGITRLQVGGDFLQQPADPVTVRKLVSLDTADLSYGVEGGAFAGRIHHLTPYSAGVMSDVAAGGLKWDLNLLAESSALPAELAGMGIYQQKWGIDIPSDPTWREAHGFARLFNEPGVLRSDGGVPVLAAYAPPGWQAFDEVSRVVNTARPEGPVLLPSVAKVDVVFSLSARPHQRGTHPVGSPPFANPPAATVDSVRPPLTNPWGQWFNGTHKNSPSGTPPSSFVFGLDLIYTPLVTLHNPYNVAIEFPSLKVEFRNLPLQFQFLRNGSQRPNNSTWTDFKQMISKDGVFIGDNYEKVFGLTLQSSLGSASAPLRLLPGETRVFSPEISGMENFTYYSDAWMRHFWDVNTNKWRNAGVVGVREANLTATPGWRGEQFGFEKDSILHQSLGNYHESENGYQYMAGAKGVPLRENDQVVARIRPYPEARSGGTTESKFAVAVSLPGTAAPASVIQFDYGEDSALLNRLKQTWPSGAASQGYLESPSWSAHQDLHDHYSRRMADFDKVKAFALFSASAKTTHGGDPLDSTNLDGGYAGKPWMFNNYTGAVSHQDIVNQHPAVLPYELKLIPLPGDTNEAIQIINNRGNFVTGHSATRGIKFGTVHDIPLAPIQSLVSLNAANLGSSFYSPTFISPIGNSYAHPMLPPAAVTTPGGGADHSFLLNAALYDSFFCSGIQANLSDFGDGRDAATVASDFLSGTRPLADRRFFPYLPGGAAPTAVEEILASPDAYREAAAHMLLSGAFNVNSTSVEAWTAMLASMSPEGGSAFVANISGSGMEALAAEQGDGKGACFSRFRLPNSHTTDSREDYWQGPRMLSETELTALAEAIVDEVKTRGPFLSVGEFVNRRVGPSDPLTQRGAIQAAINQAGINASRPAGTGIEIGMGDLDDPRYEGVANKEALVGASAQGGAGYLTQADVLGVLGNAISVRSDTFVIRAYGDATDRSGRVTARAYCEAVVQRLPDYVDGSEPASAHPPARPANLAFGRRLALRSFRWLKPEEI